MAENEKKLIENLAKLPEASRRRFLDKISAVADLMDDYYIVPKPGTDKEGKSDG